MSEPRRAIVDLIVAVTLAGVMAVLGTVYVRQVIAAGGRAEFFQIEFGPAVMVTCGRGYVSPDTVGIPPLREFLETGRDAFACADLPDAVATRTLSGPQATWKYLLYSVAMWWKVFGISWSGLVPMSGVFFGACTAFVYALCRFVANRWLSGLAAIVTMTSPLHLTELPHLRDYSKAPFMMALLVILALLMTDASRPRRVVWWAGLFGVVLGLGIGFRNDLLIMIPPFGLVVATLPGGLPAARTKVVAALVASASFLLVATPVLSAYGTGGGASMSHVALLGLTTPFDRSLGVESDGVYEFGYQYSDSYIAAMVGAFAGRLPGGVVPIAPYSPAYDAAATDYLWRIARTLPADALVRGYAAMRRVIELPSSETETEPLPYVSGSFVSAIYAARRTLAAATAALWLPVVVVAILMVSASDLRMASIVTVLLVYLASYPAIQYHERHAFHLNLVPIAAAVYVLPRVAGYVRRILSIGPQSAAERRAMPWTSRIRPLVFGAVVAACLVAPLAVLRAYQQREVEALIRGYLSAPRERLGTAEHEIAAGRTAVDLLDGGEPLGADATPGVVHSHFLLVEFGGAACSARHAPLTFRYIASHPFVDFSYEVPVSPPMDRGKTAAVLASTFAYEQRTESVEPTRVHYRFSRLEIATRARPCITGVYRIADTSRFPVLLNANLRPDWDRRQMFDTLAGWERRRPGIEPTVITYPADLPVTRDDIARATIPVTTGELADRLGGVKVGSPGAFAFDGRPAGRFTYVMQTKPRQMTAGTRLVAEGRVIEGGLTIGLVHAGSWALQTQVVVPGPFVDVFEVPSDGEYTLVVANNLPESSRRNNFALDRLAWTR